MSWPRRAWHSSMIVADVVRRAQHRGADDRLVDLVDLAVGVLRRVGHRDLLAVLHVDAVDDVGRGRDELEVELALEPLADDLEVQQAEEADAEAEAQRAGRLRLVDERGVVELQLLERVTQRRVVVAVERVEAGEHHRVRGLVAAERLGRAADVRRDGVAHPGLADLLDAGDEVADLTDAEVAGLDRLRRDDADLEHLVHGAGRHHLDPVAVRELAVDDADVRHDAPVGVVDRVEDQRARRRVRIALGRRDLVDDQVEQLLNTLAGLGRDPQDVVGVAADDAGDLRGVLLRLRAGQVDLVEHGDDVEVGVDREVEVGERLRLDALSGVDEQDSALARLEAAATS